MNLSREELLSHLRDMNGHRFEELVADIWEQEGWETTVTHGSGDDGIDIIVEKNSPFNPSQKYIIQTKCYSDKPVGGPDMRDFRGAMDLAHNADGGVFVTTSYFTASAEETADGLSMKLDLVDGDDLCKMILDLTSQRFLSDYINVDGTDEAYPETRAREVEKAFVDFFDIDLNLVEDMSVDAHRDGFTADEGIIPEMSDHSKKIVHNGFDYFNLAEGLDDYLGDSEGSASVATQVIKHGLSVRQVMAVLVENGDMRQAWNKIHQMRAETDPTTQTILGYMFLKHSLEWDAEKEKA